MIIFDVNKISVIDRPTVVGLPNGSYLEYFGKFLGSGYTGSYFIIFRPENDWDYTDFRLVVVSKNGVCHNEIEKVIRYRDGGTTEVHAEMGRFDFPSCFHPERKPTFNGQEMIEVYPRV